jgi:Domain of unknown function (DUF3850)
MVHELRCWPEPFAAIRLGLKTYEVRSMDGGQKRFNTGDLLVLREWDPDPRRHGPDFTGRSVVALVTSVCVPAETPADWGIQPAGYIAIMGFRVVEEVRSSG